MSVKRAGEWFADAAGAPHQEAERDRGPRAEGNPRAAEVPGRRRPRISHASRALRHAVRRREPAHPPRLADRLGAHRRALRAGRAQSIGLHQRDNARLLDTLQAPARPRQHRDRGRARRGRHPHRRPCARHRPRRRHPRRRDRGAGPGRRPDRQLDIRSPANISPANWWCRSPSARARSAPRAQGRQCARQQPEERHRRDPARPVHLRHRRLRRRQVHPAGRHALQGDRAQAQRRQRSPRPARPHRGAGAPRQDHRHRPVADRPHAALQPRDLYRRVHADPRVVRRPARSRRRAATSPAASASTSRAAAARPARATASSRSRCTSCPTSTSPATSARASATTARRWR